MEVELNQALLATRPRDDLTLLALCAFGLSGRHRVLPDRRELWNNWAAQLPTHIAEEVYFAWDASESQASIGNASESISVRPVVPLEFGRSPIELSPSEALALLGRPLRILLENGRNDRAFLLAFADGPSRTALENAEREGWIVFETAGGIGELLHRIQDAPNAAPREVFRAIYICDSDARESGRPSTESVNVQSALSQLSSRYHRSSGYFGIVLSRRAAENYAPPAAILDWASTLEPRQLSGAMKQASTPEGRGALAGQPGAQGSSRRRILAAIAFRELSTDLRCFLDMKEGRERRSGSGQRTVRTADVVWNRLDEFQQAVLFNGFGATFAAEFYTDRTDLPDETGEIANFLRTIKERL